MKYVGLYNNAKDIVTKDKLDDVTSRVSTNEDNIAMAESDIEGLQTTVGTLQTNVNNVQTALTSKQDTVVGGASTITENNLTANRALISNSSGKVAVSDVTSTELGYLDGVTSNVQTQLGGKQPTITVNGIIQGDGAGNLSAVEAISADLLDLNPAAVGLGNVVNERQYSADNPPPYPVYGVNGDTGDVYTQPYKVYGTLSGAVVTGTIEAPESELNKISLNNGTAVILIPDADCPSQCAFNFNDLGARIIVRTRGDTNNSTAVGNANGWLKANKPVLLIYYKISDTNGQWIIQNMSRPVATDLVATGAKGQVLGFTARNKIGAMDAPSGTKIVVNSETPTGLSSGDWWYQIN